ncbi:hypothetical protein LPJ66_007965 [Kickxella alabastrina]|uniref:Uncharacterized protein n=1 Tax=Kickxella alabastrina TaxID=61397 RepID=A0ACC1I9Q3_9FUNG|nr:hypothetical protein LPJ66_007965 [Kickxella alabastrina]
MFFSGFPMNSYTNINDMPPADWCMTTLQTLSNKYEHLADSRKVNPPFAEAVLNSFKSKLLNLVSAQAFYDSEDSSEAEAEWPLGGDNYLTIAPLSIIEPLAAHVSYAKDSEEAEGDMTTGLLSPSPSPTSAVGTGSYLDACDLAATVEYSDNNIALGADDAVVLPPSIEEALRRFLANTNNQDLSNTFTTFADADTTAAAVDSSNDDGDDDNSDAQISDLDNTSDSSDSLESPESPCSPEEPLDYLPVADAVDVFVKGYAVNGGWELVQSPLCALDNNNNDNNKEDALLPCKRKRCKNSEELEEAEQNAASGRQTQLPRKKLLPLSPRKRSRSVPQGDTAAVPIAKNSVEASLTVVTTAEKQAATATA